MFLTNVCVVIDGRKVFIMLLRNQDCIGWLVDNRIIHKTNIYKVRFLTIHLPMVSIHIFVINVVRSVKTTVSRQYLVARFKVKEQTE